MLLLLLLLLVAPTPRAGWSGLERGPAAGRAAAGTGAGAAGAAQVVGSERPRATATWAAGLRSELG